MIENSYDATDPASLIESLYARMPNTVSHAEVHLRDAADEFFLRSECWQDQRLGIAPSEGQTRYTMPQPALTGCVSRVIDVYDSVADGADAPLPRHEERHTGAVRWYTPDRSTIVFHEPLDITHVYRLHAVLVPDSRGVAEPMLGEHKEAILAGAMYRAAMAQSQNTEDQRRAMIHRDLFEAAIRDASLVHRITFGAERRPMSRYAAATRAKSYQ